MDDRQHRELPRSKFRLLIWNSVTSVFIGVVILGKVLPSLLEGLRLDSKRYFQFLYPLLDSSEGHPYFSLDFPRNEQILEVHCSAYVFVRILKQVEFAKQLPSGNGPLPFDQIDLRNTVFQHINFRYNPLPRKQRRSFRLDGYI